MAKYVFAFLFTVNFHVYSHPEQFSINGFISSSNGVIILNQIVLDTSINVRKYQSKIDNGKFYFQGDLDELNGYYFEVENKDGLITRSDLFLLESGVQNAYVDTKFPQIPLIKNKLMAVYNSHIYFREKKTLLKNFIWLDSLENSILLEPCILQDSLKSVYKQIRKNYLDREKDLGQNLHSYFSDSNLSLWNIYLKYTESYDINKLLFFFNSLSKNIKQSSSAKIILNYLLKFDPFSEGKLFPLINLYSLKDQITKDIYFNKKYTLIDFWWSGCGHCIKEFPAFLELYSGEAKSILDVVQISVDKTNTLKQLHQIRNRFYFPWREFLDENGEVTRFLKLYSFPSNFLVDSRGVILKKNIRPHELQQFIQSLE